MSLTMRKRQLNEEDDVVDLTNLIDPLVLLSGLLMLVIPSVNIHIREAKLTEAGGPSATASDENAPLIEFLNDGRLLWNQQPVTQTQFAQQLRTLPDKSRVLLAGDHEARYGTGLTLRVQLQDAGLHVVELTSRPSTGP